MAVKMNDIEEIPDREFEHYVADLHCQEEKRKRLDAEMYLYHALNFMLFTSAGMIFASFVIALFQLGMPKFEHYDVVILFVLLVFALVMYVYANAELGRKDRNE